jgi:hypothetical protein
MADATSGTTNAIPSSRLMGILVLCAVLSFLCLMPRQTIPEVPVGIDQNAFFISLMFVALLPLLPRGRVKPGHSVRFDFYIAAVGRHGRRG